MTEAPSELEERLLHGYRAQLDRYDRAAEILAKACADGSPHDGHWAHALQATLEEAAALNAAMAEDSAAFRETGQTPVGPLQEILERLAERIRRLREDIDRQVADMRSRQSGLAVEIDEFIQNRRMLQAYVKHG